MLSLVSFSIIQPVVLCMSNLEQDRLQGAQISPSELDVSAFLSPRHERDDSMGIPIVELVNYGSYRRDFRQDQEISPEAKLPIPKVLLFDLGHVFLDADYMMIYQAFEELGIPEERARQIFNLSEYYDFSRGKIDGHTLCDAIRTLLDTPNLTDTQIREIHDKHIFGLIPGMKGMLEQVTEKYGTENIVFVTDTCDWQTQRQQQLLDLSPYRVITSNSIGMVKLDPEIIDEIGHRQSFFLSVLEQLQINAEEALLIDDNPRVVEVARRYGFQTIQFEGKAQLETAFRQRSVIE